MVLLEGIPPWVRMADHIKIVHYTFIALRCNRILSGTLYTKPYFKLQLKFPKPLCSDLFHEILNRERRELRFDFTTIGFPVGTASNFGKIVYRFRSDSFRPGNRFSRYQEHLSKAVEVYILITPVGFEECSGVVIKIG